MRGQRAVWCSAATLLALLGLVPGLAGCGPDQSGVEGVLPISASPHVTASAPTASSEAPDNRTSTRSVTPERSPAVSEAPQEVNRAVEQTGAERGAVVATERRLDATHAESLSSAGPPCGGFNFPILGEPPNKPVLQWWPDGSSMLLHYGFSGIYVAAADGLQVRRIIDAPIDTSARLERRLDGNGSPDGTQIAFTRCRDFGNDRTYEISIWNPEEKTTRRLAFGVVPVWSPDGTRIAFFGHPTEKELAHLYTITADGADWRRLATATRVGRPPEGAPDDGWRLSTVVRVTRPPQWAPDGRRLAFVQDMVRVQEERGPGDGRYAIYTIAADGADPLRLTPTVSDPSWSPDGSRLAFAKPEANAVALYTIAADGTDAQRVTTITGWEPSRGPADPARAWIESVAWSPDGSKILYSCGGICVVELDGTPVSAAPLPGVLAAWSPDGSRIAILNTAHPILQAVAPDGSDPRLLVLVQEDGLAAVAPRPLEEPVDVSDCSSGHTVPDPTNNPGLVQDCETLLVLQARLAGVEGFGWVTYRPITEWEGVVLGDWPLRVRRLTLAGRGLTGVIPPELAQLTQLARLNLAQNRFAGEIPPELGTLKELRVLDLGWNYLLSGAIPAELAGLTKLQRLDLGWNDLTGTVPRELGSLTRLGVVILAGNRLTGCIPPTIGRRVVDRKNFLGLPFCGEA